MGCVTTGPGYGVWGIGNCLSSDVGTTGFARSFGLQLPGGQRREWIKPIMFSGGIGSMEAEHVSKEPPEPGKNSLAVWI